MPADEAVPDVTVAESGNGRYGQIVSAGHHIQGADEPEKFGGHDTGMSPYQYLMAALGACTAMTLRMYADRHGYPLQHVSVDLTHRRVVGAPGEVGRDHFRRLIHLSGDLTPEQRARLAEIAEKCPVSQTLERGSVAETALG